MRDSARRVLVRFAPVIYGPTVLFALGEGAVIPLIPVIAAELGANLALSAFIASTLVIGQLCGNLPAGWFVARFGERRTMALAAFVALAGAAGLGLARHLALLTVSVFVIGLAAAAFALARHAFMTVHVPFAFRARALALLGGAFRLGMFAGPFVSALLLSLTGSNSSVIWFFAAALVACATLVLLGKDPERALAGAAASARRESAGGGSGNSARHQTPGVFATMREYRGVLARIGLSAAALSAVRQARQVVLPLWGVSLGLEAHTIALVVGISGALDFALFYVSGQVMDRFGRIWAVVPSMLLMAAGFLVLACTQGLSDAPAWYLAMAALIGVGNGLSSGILMTLGADLAPRADPAPFLGSWRLLSDTGGALAPVLFSGIAAVATIGLATASIGVIALAGVCGFARWLPRFTGRQ